MDGDALALAFAAHSGPDCLKDVVSKYGFRLKVYQAIKAELEANRTQVKFLIFDLFYRLSRSSKLILAYRITVILTIVE